MPYMTLDGSELSLTISDLRAKHPNVSWPVSPSEEDLATFGYRWYAEAPRPDTDDYHTVVEAAPVLTDKGFYQQTWEVVDLRVGMTVEQLAGLEAAILARNTPPVPFSVTMAQFRRALLRAEILTEAQTFVDAEGGELAVAWEYDITVPRIGYLAEHLADGLDLTDEELDVLFRVAGSIS